MVSEVFRRAIYEPGGSGGTETPIVSKGLNYYVLFTLVYYTKFYHKRNTGTKIREIKT